MKHFLLILLYIFLINPIFGAPDKYVIATHPKGGSHLLIKILNIIHGERPATLFAHFDGYNFGPWMVDECWKKGGMPWMHIWIPDFTCGYFAQWHLDYKIIVIIRDIRDAYVSYGHWLCGDPTISEQEKINIAFSDGNYGHMCSKLSMYTTNPRFYVIRFEDLIGPKGQGKQEKQIETIFNLASYIGMPISKEQALEYGEKLFGATATFREGQIGSWKNACSESQKAWLKENFGEELIRLGYEKDLNW